MSAPPDPLWRLLLALAERRRAGTLPAGPAGFRLDGADVVTFREGRGGRGRRSDRGGRRGAGDPFDSNDPEGGSARAALVRRADGTFACGEALTGAERDAVEPLLVLLGASAARPIVVAHLGQSVDGCIATASGHSQVVTGPEDFDHMHRLRALADAVVVGGGTVAADDPRLTTRRVAGPSPVRVVVDPASRLVADRDVFVDGAAPTLRVHVAHAPPPAVTAAHVEPLALPFTGMGDGGDERLLRDALVARGLHALFVEGGGVTVTRWLAAGLVARLHVVVAPVIIGAGRAGLSLVSAPTMHESLRPPCRVHRLGEDVLWDFDLGGT